MHYDCTSLDLYDRSAVATLNRAAITADLAIRTLKKAIQQNMSRANYLYDNAPMERFFNTLKNEYFNLRKFKDIESLNTGIYRFVYCLYNRKRPHSHNGGQTPWATRLEA